jgi:hypothetical protein
VYESDNKIALYVENASISDNNLGKLVRGYNIVSEEVANKWVEKNSKVRIATPQEVAAAYGV